VKIAMLLGEAMEFSRSRVLKDRVLFYVGIILIVIGGPGLSLGSFAHDIYNIPLIGEAFNAFGWLNVTFLVVGLVLLVVGILLVALSLRGGLLPGAMSSERAS
jgi:uncharacterized membrane protein